MRQKLLAVVRYLLPTLLVCAAIGAGVKLGTLGSHRGVGASENYAVPIGEAGPQPAMCGTYANGLDPLCLHGTVCSPGQFIGGIDGGTFGCAVPTGDGGSVPGFTAGGDLYGSNSFQGVQSLSGDSGLVVVGPDASSIQWAASGHPTLSQAAQVDGGGANFAINPQPAGFDGGSGGLVVTVAPPAGAVTTENGIQLVRGDAGGADAAIALISGYPGLPLYGCLHLGAGSVPGNTGNTPCNIDYGGDYSAGGNGIMSFASQGTMEFNVDGYYAFGMNGNGTSAGSFIFSNVKTMEFAAGVSSPIFGQDAAFSDVPTQTLTIRSQSAWSGASTNTSGAPIALLGGAKTSGSGGSSLGVQLGVGASASSILFEAAYPSSQYLTVFNQVGSGIGSAALPNGSGISVVYDAQTNETTCDATRATWWASTSGVLYFCNAGGSPTAWGATGSCSLGGDVTGSCGSNAVTSITGNGSGVVAVVANNFAYAGGGLLQWTSSGSGYFGAAGAMTVASTGGAALFEGATAELAATGLATMQGANIVVNALSGSLSLEVAGTPLGVFTTTNVGIGAAGSISLIGTAGASLTAGTGALTVTSTSGSALLQGYGVTTVQSSSSSLYLNAGGSGQYVHEQVAGVDQIVIDSAYVNFANQSVSGFSSGATLMPKPAGFFKLKVGGTIYEVALFPNGT